MFCFGAVEERIVTLFSDLSFLDFLELLIEMEVTKMPDELSRAFIIIWFLLKEFHRQA